MALLAVALWLGRRGFLVFPHTPMKHVQAQHSSYSIKLAEATPKVLPDEVWITVEEGQSCRWWSGRTSVFRSFSLIRIVSHDSINFAFQSTCEISSCLTDGESYSLVLNHENSQFTVAF